MVEALIAAGAAVEATNAFGRTPLHEAARANESADVLKALLDAGANPATVTMLGNTPLHGAARLNSNVEVVRTLLGAGAEPTLGAGFFAHTPLHFAAKHNENALMVQTLLDAGVSAGITGEHSWTPLHDAVQFSENPEIVRRLLEAGAEPMARDGWGRTALHVALEFNRSANMVRLLLDAGADPMAIADQSLTYTSLSDYWGAGATPLHSWALGPADAGTLDTLLRAGADVAALDAQGRTPLHWAARNRRGTAADAVMQILALGGDSGTESIDGRTAWDYAQTNETLWYTPAFELLQTESP